MTVRPLVVPGVVLKPVPSSRRDVRVRHAVAAATVLTLAGCAAERPAPASADGISAATALVAELCAVRDGAAAPQRARDRFFDDAHAPLHDLADRVAERDRTAAAELLRAKQAVEETLDGDRVEPAVLRDRADRLAAAAAAGYAALDLEVPAC